MNFSSGVVFVLETSVAHTTRKLITFTVAAEKSSALARTLGRLPLSATDYNHFKLYLVARYTLTNRLSVCVDYIIII